MNNRIGGPANFDPHLEEINGVPKIGIDRDTEADKLDARSVRATEAAKVLAESQSAGRRLATVTDIVPRLHSDVEVELVDDPTAEALRDAFDKLGERVRQSNIPTDEKLALVVLLLEQLSKAEKTPVSTMQTPKSATNQVSYNA